MQVTAARNYVIAAVGVWSPVDFGESESIGREEVDDVDADPVVLVWLEINTQLIVEVFGRLGDDEIPEVCG